MSPGGTLGLLAADWAAMAAVMAGAWLLQRRSGDAGVVDVAWAAGLGLTALIFALVTDGHALRRALVAAMVGLWGFRLAGHLLVDRVLSEEEDGRYRWAREQWGESAQRNLFLFYQFQALSVPILALAFLPAMRHPAEELRVLDAVGVALWITSLGGEWVADRQLARFKRRPGTEGRVCRDGLWAWSRHPNYFFEWIHWWAYVAIAAGYPGGWVALLGPALMLFLILRVTGVPPTEAQALRSRGEAYRHYQRTTSVFLPLPPREEPEARPGPGE